MVRVGLASVFVLMTAFLSVTPVRAEDVDVALVLVTDVSRSVDDREYKLEKDGYTSAFTNDKVLEAIQGSPIGRIAVAYVEFASSSEVRTVLDWTVIKDWASAKAFLPHSIASLYLCC